VPNRSRSRLPEKARRSDEASGVIVAGVDGSGSSIDTRDDDGFGVRGLARAAVLGLRRLCPGERLGDRLDLGEQPLTDRDVSLGVLKPPPLVASLAGVEPVIGGRKTREGPRDHRPYAPRAEWVTTDVTLVCGEAEATGRGATHDHD